MSGQYGRQEGGGGELGASGQVRRRGRRAPRAAAPDLRDGTRRVRLVRGEGRGVSDQYGVRDAACPLSTRGLVRRGGGGGATRGRCRGTGPAAGAGSPGRPRGTRGSRVGRGRSPRCLRPPPRAHAQLAVQSQLAQLAALGRQATRWGRRRPGAVPPPLPSVAPTRVPTVHSLPGKNKTWRRHLRVRLPRAPPLRAPRPSY